jgi:hypothetical protein
MVGQMFKFVWRLCWKINVVCMSLSPFDSFQSRFVTYWIALVALPVVLKIHVFWVQYIGTKVSENLLLPSSGQSKNSLDSLKDEGISLLQNHFTGEQNFHIRYQMNNYTILNFYTYPLLPIGQEWGLSDECVSKWASRLPFWIKLLPHWSHVKFRIPVWIRLCVTKFGFVENL